MEKIGKILPTLKKSDFVINRPQGLFPPDWEAKDHGFCPHCYSKLYPMWKKSGWGLCKSKKHKGGKIFKLSTLQKKP